MKMPKSICQEISAWGTALTAVAILTMVTDELLAQEAVAAPQASVSAAPADARGRAEKRPGKTAEGNKSDGENKKNDGEAAEGKKKKGRGRSKIRRSHNGAAGSGFRAGQSH